MHGSIQINESNIGIIFITASAGFEIIFPFRWDTTAIFVFIYASSCQNIAFLYRFFLTTALVIKTNWNPTTDCIMPVAVEIAKSPLFISPR